MSTAIHSVLDPLGTITRAGEIRQQTAFHKPTGRCRMRYWSIIFTSAAIARSAQNAHNPAAYRAYFARRARTSGLILSRILGSSASSSSSVHFVRDPLFVASVSLSSFKVSWKNMMESSRSLPSAKAARRIVPPKLSKALCVCARKSDHFRREKLALMLPRATSRRPSGGAVD